MAVNLSTPPASEAGAPAAPAVPPTFKLELSRVSRFVYGGQVYVKGEMYVFTDEDTRHMLNLTDPQEIPVFRMARARKKLVAVDDDSGIVVGRAKPTKVDRIRMDLQDFKANQVTPVGKIEIPDDDPEMLERLQAIDNGGQQSGEIDTGEGQAL